MDRYYFHVADGRDYPDLQGTELPDLDAAQKEALRFARSILTERGSEFWSGQEWTMRVSKADDVTLFKLVFMASSAPDTQGH